MTQNYIFEKANPDEFTDIQHFYWRVIDDIHKNNVNHENLGWEKGVYPSDDFLKTSLQVGNLYILKDNNALCACVILNSEWNEGYNDCPWSIHCDASELLVPHALAVDPQMQGKGIGKLVVNEIVELARTEHKKAVRLDVLGACKAAERLYTSCGFQFVKAKDMYYEDTGWTEYKMFELNL